MFTIFGVADFAYHKWLTWAIGTGTLHRLNRTHADILSNEIMKKIWIACLVHRWVQ